MDLFEKELELEEQMRDLGTKAFRSEVERAQRDGREGDVRHGQLLVRAAIQPVAEAIEEFVAAAYSGRKGRRHAAAKYLRDIDPQVAAFIATKTILTAVSREQTLVAVALNAIRQFLKDNGIFPEAPSAPTPAPSCRPLRGPLVSFGGFGRLPPLRDPPTATQHPSRLDRYIPYGNQCRAVVERQVPRGPLGDPPWANPMDYLGFLFNTPF